MSWASWPGTTTPTFQPLETVSRAVFAEVLLRILGEETNSEPGDSDFSDVPPDLRFRPYVDRLYELGITRGCRSAPLMYCPDEPITRAELASFLGGGFQPGAGCALRGHHHHRTDHHDHGLSPRLIQVGIRRVRRIDEVPLRRGR